MQTEYSLEDLRRIKREWYEEALHNGTLDKIGTVCRELGENAKASYGPKYTYSRNGIYIYVDDYGHFMTVEFNGKKVCSTHPCERLFAKGEWISLIDNEYPIAIEKLNKRKTMHSLSERDKLAEELGL